MTPFDARPVDKQRFLSALMRRPAQEVPYFETEFSAGVTSRILDKEVTVRSYDLPAKDYVEFLRRVGIDVGYLSVGWRLGRKEYVDGSGRSHYVDGAIKRRADLEQVVPPSLDSVKRRIEEFLKAADGTGLGWIYRLESTSDIVPSIGFEDYYLSLHDDPEFLEEFINRYEDYVLPLTDLVLSYKPDAVFLAASTCIKTGMVMAMEHAERFVFSGLARQMSLIRDKDVPAIIHSDGDNSSIMDRWIELGFSGFHPVEPCGELDIYEVKSRWGDRIALLGNVDVAGVLSDGTPDDVARDTLTHLERLSTNGGYVCGSSHDIDDNIPDENLMAMIEAITSWKIRRE